MDLLKVSNYALRQDLHAVLVDALQIASEDDLDVLTPKSFVHMGVPFLRLFV